MSHLLLLTESWCALIAAIIFGVLGTLSMKLSQRFRKIKPTIAMAVFYCLSFIAMTFALKAIEVSIAYATWSGVGTVLAMFLGVLLFGESISWRKSFFLFLIVAGIIGIQFAHGSL
ncbi:MAG TPA: multidrug efflux SMR transporter [Gammaproteobacteria bacterium]|nr:multidrug efflux SMR transporter [Gammaproteobacteria bacterium]